MNEREDEWLQLTLSREQPASGTSEPWMSALALVDEVAGPPAVLKVTGRKDSAVTSARDPKIAKAMSAIGGRAIRVEGPSYTVLALPGDYRSVLSVFVPPGDAQRIRRLFVDLIKTFQPDMAYAHFSAARRQLGRTKGLPNGPLSWLTYYDRAEADRRGGVASLSKLDGAASEPIGDGVLLQIGEPGDALAEAGVNTLLEVARRLPRPPASPPGPIVDVVRAAAPAELEEIAGVRGIREGGVLWVMKHLATGQHLPAKEIEQLRAALGKGSPPVSEVRVLFSDERVARDHAAALRSAGLDVWYVSDVDAQKHRAP